MARQSQAMLSSVVMTASFFFRGISALLLILLGGCFFSTQRAPEPPQRKWLRWVMANDPGDLDWTKCERRNCRSATSLLMEGLVRAEYVNGILTPLPALADAWSTPSSRKYLFHLRPTAIWSNGIPLQASHVVEAVQRSVSKCRTSAIHPSLLQIKGVRNYCASEGPISSIGVQAASPREVLFTLEAPSPLFPLVLSLRETWPVDPRFSPGQVDGPVLGPYLLERWVRGKEIKFARNPRYYGGPANIAGISTRIEPDGMLRLQLFLNGEADLVDEISEDVASVVAAENLGEKIPTNQLVFLQINTRNRPLNLLGARQGLLKSINRAELADLVNPTATVAAQFSLMQNSVPTKSGGSSSLGLGSLLSELKLSAPEISTVPKSPPRWFSKPLLVASDNTELMRSAFRNLQAQWSKRLEASLEWVSAGPKKNPNTSAGLYLRQRDVDFVPSWSNLKDLFVEATGSSSRNLENLVQEVGAASDPASFRSLNAKAEQFLTDEKAVLLPLFFETRIVLKSAHLRGWTMGPLGEWKLNNPRLD